MSAPVTCAVGLRCIDCAAEYPLEYVLACRRCRGLLEPVYDLEPLRRLGPDRAFTGRGFWRYHPVLPIRDRAHFVTLGEGETPLLDAPTLARTLGVRRLALKFEGANPTGTIKDRSSATAVAAARQFGFRAISVVSTGNAGSSIGAYATRAGLRAFVFCYEQASAPKMHHMAAVASDLILYKGYYDDLIRLWDRMVESYPSSTAAPAGTPTSRTARRPSPTRSPSSPAFASPMSSCSRSRWEKPSSRPGAASASWRAWAGSNGRR
jgi:threonine synthase